jgi:tripartite-type tricarboxylate transporter receptor subunit TctC
MPEVATFSEQGLDGVDASSYWGLFAPAGTPAQILSMVSEHVARALKEPEVLDRLIKAGFVPIGSTPQAHTDMTRTMIARWTEVIQKAGIKLD